MKSERNPVSLEHFAIANGIEQLLHDQNLREALTKHERVIYNERNNTLQWKPDYDLRTPQDLLNLVRIRYQNAYPPQSHGFKLADLRESYPATREAVDNFAKPRQRKSKEAVEEETEGDAENGINGEIGRAHV